MRSSRIAKVELHPKSTYLSHRKIGLPLPYHRPSGKSKGVSLLTMLATKEDLREFSEDPSLVPIVLMHKGEILVSNDMPPISLGVSTILQEFGDVFPAEVPSVLPPLREIEHQIDLIPGSSLPKPSSL